MILDWIYSIYHRAMEIKSDIKYHIFPKEKIRQDCWSLDFSLSEWIVPRLKYLRDTLNGYPSNIMEDKQLIDAAVSDGMVLSGDSDVDAAAIWKYALNRMISAFEYVISDGYWSGSAPDKLKFDVGMDIFRKYFSSLWD